MSEWPQYPMHTADHARASLLQAWQDRKTGVIKKDEFIEVSRILEDKISEYRAVAPKTDAPKMRINFNRSKA